MFLSILKCFRLKTARATDERVHVTNEAIAGMRIIKMYSWEKSFKEILSGLRKYEMRAKTYIINFTCNTFQELF